MAAAPTECRRSHRRPVVVLLLALALVTAACGARWTDEQRAAMALRASKGASATATVEEGTAADAGATGDVGSGAASSNEAANGPSAASGATAAKKVAPSTLPCAAPSNAPGVTDKVVTIGSISSTSGIVPGLGTSSQAAVRAHVGYRNATGGVCGRQLALRDADDGGDSGRYRTILREMAKQVIGITGGLTIADDGSGDVFASEQLPMVASRSGEGVQGQPTVFDLNPPFADLKDPIGKYDYIFAKGARTVALAYLAVDASRAEALTQRTLMEASGLRIVDVNELPVSTLSYDAAARRVANSKAQYMFFIGEANSNASMARSMAETGYELLFEEYFTFAYGEHFVELAGDASEGATTWIRTLPNEEAPSNAAMGEFVRWMDRSSPGTVKDTFAAESWVAAKAMVDALEALPGPISRQALVQTLRGTDRYDAGGMLGPIRLGPQQNLGCFIGMQVKDGTWRRMTPATGFVC